LVVMLVALCYFDVGSFTLSSSLWKFRGGGLSYLIRDLGEGLIILNWSVASSKFRILLL
jgi:hypothetical protein